MKQRNRSKKKTVNTGRAIITGLPSEIFHPIAKKLREQEALDHSLKTFGKRINKVDLDSYVLGISVGSRKLYKDMMENKTKENIKRTGKSTETRQQQQKIKNDYVTKTYIKMVNEGTEKAILNNLSENEMAKRVKARVEDDLKNARTPQHKAVLKSKVNRKGDVTHSGLSTRTIIRILRNQNFSFYPWGNK